MAETLIDKRIRELKKGIKTTTDKKLSEANYGKIILLKAEKQRVTKQLKDKVKSFSEYPIKTTKANQEFTKKETEFEAAKQQLKSDSTKLDEKINEIGKKRNTMSDEELELSEESDISTILFLQNEKLADINIIGEKRREMTEADRLIRETAAQKKADKILLESFEAILQ